MERRSPSDLPPLACRRAILGFLSVILVRCRFARAHRIADFAGNEVAEASGHDIDSGANSNATAKAKYNPLNWIMRPFPRWDVADHMVRASCRGQTPNGDFIPNDFGGLFWQDGVMGRGSPEVVASFSSGKWEAGLDACRKSTIFHYTDDEKRSGTIKVGGPFQDSVPCRGVLRFFYFGHRTWAWNSLASLGLAAGAMGATLTGTMQLEMVCGGKDPNFLTICKISQKPHGKINRTLTNAASYVFPLEWSQVRVADDMWVRYSLWPANKLGIKIVGPDQYFVKRIVNCDGQPNTRFWKQFSWGGFATDLNTPHQDVFGNKLANKFRLTSPVPLMLSVRVSLSTDRVPNSRVRLDTEQPVTQVESTSEASQATSTTTRVPASVAHAAPYESFDKMEMFPAPISMTAPTRLQTVVQRPSASGLVDDTI